MAGNLRSQTRSHWIISRRRSHRRPGRRLLPPDSLLRRCQLSQLHGLRLLLLQRSREDQLPGLQLALRRCCLCQPHGPSWLMAGANASGPCCAVGACKTRALLALRNLIGPLVSQIRVMSDAMKEKLRTMTDPRDMDPAERKRQLEAR